MKIVCTKTSDNQQRIEQIKRNIQDNSDITLAETSEELSIDITSMYNKDIHYLITRIFYPIHEDKIDYKIK